MAKTKCMRTKQFFLAQKLKQVSKQPRGVKMWMNTLLKANVNMYVCVGNAQQISLVTGARVMCIIKG